MIKMILKNIIINWKILLEISPVFSSSNDDTSSFVNTRVIKLKSES